MDVFFCLVPIFFPAKFSPPPLETSEWQTSILQGLESMLKALLQEKVLTKVGGWDLGGFTPP